jgi:hypothetical protein
VEKKAVPLAQQRKGRKIISPSFFYNSSLSAIYSDLVKQSFIKK